MPVDHAEVLRRLKGVIASKPSHGQRDLLAAVGRLEAECDTDDGEYQRFLRRFGDEVMEAALNLVPPDGGMDTTGAASPLTEPAASGVAMATGSPPSIGARSATEETTCRRTRRTAPPARVTS